MKFIASNTVEEKVLSLQRSKAHLLQDIFSASEVVNSKISLDVIKDLLKA